jgi:hypothetical protein
LLGCTGEIATRSNGDGDGDGQTDDGDDGDAPGGGDEPGDPDGPGDPSDDPGDPSDDPDDPDDPYDDPDDPGDPGDPGDPADDDSDLVFAPGVVTTYDIAMAPADWDAVVDDPFDETYRAATITWEGETYPNVGVRAVGRNRSPGFGKPSLKLKFDEFVDQTFHGLKVFKLQGTWDGGGGTELIREAIAYAAHRAIGVPAPRYAHARVVVNGEVIGVYGVEEWPDKTYVRRRFGPTVSQLYKWMAPDPQDMAWIGGSPGDYVPYPLEPKFESLDASGTEVVALLDAIDNRADADAALDVDGFLRFMALHQVAGEWDDYVGGDILGEDRGLWSNNFLLYRNPATGRFVFLAWDRQNNYDPRNVDRGLFHRYGERNLTNRLILGDAANRAAYLGHVRALVDGPHSVAAVHAMVDDLAALLAPAIGEDPFVSSAPFADEVDALKANVAARDAFIRGELP